MYYRVSFRGAYDNMHSTLLHMSYDLAEANNKVATGKAVNKPSDDPVAMVSILGSRRSIAALDQYTRNMTFAESWLKTSDTALTQGAEQLIRAREIAEQMATGTFSDQQRQDAAIEVQGLIDSILTLANTRLGDSYVFSGDRIHTIPFAESLFLNSPQADPDNAADYCGLVSVSGTYYQGHANLTLDQDQMGRQRLLANYLESTASAALGYDGYFGFYYDNNGDFTGANADITDLVGYTKVTSTMTLWDIASALNNGTAARGVLSLDANVSVGAYLAVGNTVFEFVSAAGDVPAIAGAVAVVLGSNVGSATVAVSALLGALNATSTADAWAVQSTGAADANAITILARTTGSAGNGLRVAAASDLGTWTASGSLTDLSYTAVANALDTLLAFSSPTLSLGDAGQFAFWYNADGDADASEVADLFGIINLSASGTLAELRNAINAGTAARANLAFASAVGSNTIISIGNHTFEFVSQAVAADAILSGAAGTSTYTLIAMGASTLAASTALESLRASLDGLSNADCWAVISATGDESCYIFARETGYAGNFLQVATNSAHITLSGTTTSGSAQRLDNGGLGWATAEEVLASATGSPLASGYYLRLTAAGGLGLSIAATSAGGTAYLSAWTSAISGLNGGAAWSNAVSGAVCSFAGGGSAWVTADVVSGASGFQLRLTGEDANATASPAHQVYLGGDSGPLSLLSGATSVAFFGGAYDQVSEWASMGSPILYVFADKEGLSYNSVTIEFKAPSEANAALSVSVDGWAITVNLATNAGGAVSTTVGEVMRALAAEPAAAALVDAELPDGILSTTQVAAMSTTNLTEGGTSLSRRYTVEITQAGAVGGPRAAWQNLTFSGPDNDLKITAASAGSWGNNVQVRFISGVPGTASTTVQVDAGSNTFDLTVILATSADGSIIATASQVMAALNASAAAYVSAAIATGNSGGAGVVTTQAWTVLSNGAEQARFRVVEWFSGASAAGYADTYAVTSDFVQVFDERHSQYWGVKVAFSENGTTLNEGDQFYLDATHYRGDEANLKTTIGFSGTISRNVNGTAMMGGAGDADNVLDILRSLRDGLENNNQDAAQKAIVGLEEARQAMVGADVDVGARINALEVRTTVSTNFALTIQDQLDKTETVDLAGMIIELNRMQLAYQASLSSIVRVTSVSLVDYL